MFFSLASSLSESSESTVVFRLIDSCDLRTVDSRNDPRFDVAGVVNGVAGDLVVLEPPLNTLVSRFTIPPLLLPELPTLILLPPLLWLETEERFVDAGVALDGEGSD